jgi:hypothetical protein
LKPSPGIIQRVKSVFKQFIGWIAKGARNQPICDT